MSNKSVSERLKFWRAERPDEWTMDEFIRDAERLEQERDALASQVERLLDYVKRGSPWNTNTDKCERIKVLSETPPAALAALKSQWRAEAAHNNAINHELQHDPRVAVEALQAIKRHMEIMGAGNMSAVWHIANNALNKVEVPSTQKALAGNNLLTPSQVRAMRKEIDSLDSTSAKG